MPVFCRRGFLKTNPAGFKGQCLTEIVCCVTVHLTEGGILAGKRR